MPAATLPDVQLTIPGDFRPLLARRLTHTSLTATPLAEPRRLRLAADLLDDALGVAPSADEGPMLKLPAPVEADLHRPGTCAGERRIHGTKTSFETPASLIVEESAPLGDGAVFLAIGDRAGGLDRREHVHLARPEADELRRRLGSPIPQPVTRAGDASYGCRYLRADTLDFEANEEGGDPLIRTKGGVAVYLSDDDRRDLAARLLHGLDA